MKTYLDLQGINNSISVRVELSVVGTPDFSVSIGNNRWNNQHSIDVDHDLMIPFSIEIELRNKHYTLDYETAVIIDQISADNINLIPTYNQLIDYQNDHNNNSPTNYLGFNGKWTLTINRPFYQWLHQAQGQGWLLS